jgi:hypothetical protein
MHERGSGAAVDVYYGEFRGIALKVHGLHGLDPVRGNTAVVARITTISQDRSAGT